MTDQQFLDPSTHPAVRSAIEDRQYKQVGGVGFAAAVLIGVAAAANAVDTWSDWNRYQVARDFVAGDPAVTIADLDSADQLTETTAIGSTIAIVAAGVVFLVWLWRARQNAEILCLAQHRKRLGWTAGSWICPIVNFWFPYLIVDDIYRASRPSNPPELYDLRTVPGSNRLGVWWAAWLASTAASWIAVTLVRGEIDVDSLRAIAVIDTLQAGLMIAAAVLIIRIMREISAWQTPRWPT